MRLRPRIRVPRGEHGEQGAMSISLAMVFPAVLALVLLVVQACLWWYARQVALTAAREGSEAARAYQAPAGAGDVRARDVLDRLGGGLTDRQVQTSRIGAAVGGTPQITVTVSVRAESLLPFVPGLDISQHVTAPVEEFVPEPQAGPAGQAGAQAGAGAGG